MLLDLDHSDSHPRNQFILNLTKQIIQATTNNEEIILTLDSNEDILPEGVPGSVHSIINLLRDTNIVGLFEHQHEQTGDRSRRNTKKIDHVLITPNLLPVVKHSGFLPWNQIMESDHCMGFIDFDDIELFGENTEDPTNNSSRKLSTDYPESIVKYLEIMNNKIKKQEIQKALSELARKAAYKKWTDKKEQKYNNI